MATPFDETRDHQNAYVREIVGPIHLRPLPHQSKQDRDAVGGDDRVSRLSDIEESMSSTPEPIRNVDETTTQVDLPTVLTPSLSFSPAMVDGFPLDEQDTWIIPVPLPARERRATKSETQGPESEGYASQLRKLVKSSGIYALAS